MGSGVDKLASKYGLQKANSGYNPYLNEKQPTKSGVDRIASLYGLKNPNEKTITNNVATPYSPVNMTLNNNQYYDLANQVAQNTYQRQLRQQDINRANYQQQLNDYYSAQGYQAPVSSVGKQATPEELAKYKAQAALLPKTTLSGTNAAEMATANMNAQAARDAAKKDVWQATVEHLGRGSTSPTMSLGDAMNPYLTDSGNPYREDPFIKYNMDAFGKKDRETFADAASKNAENPLTIAENSKDDTYESKQYTYMSGTEKQRYNELYGAYGKDVAEAFRNMILNDINERIGNKVYADKYKEKNTAGKIGSSIALGVESGIRGLANTGEALVGTGRSKATPVSDVIASNIVSDKDNSGFQKMAYDIAQSTGNMLPSMVAGQLFGGPVGNVLFALSQYGNSYREAIDNGESNGTAGLYALQQGIDESATNAILGGLSSFGGGAVTKLLKGKLGNALPLALDSITNSPQGKALVKALLDGMADMGGEAAQEYLQFFTQNWTQALLGMKDENGNPVVANFNPADPEALYSALLGALNAAVLNTTTSGIGKAVTAVPEAKANMQQGLNALEYANKPSAATAEKAGIKLENSTISSKMAGIIDKKLDEKSLDKSAILSRYGVQSVSELNKDQAAHLVKDQNIASDVTADVLNELTYREREVTNGESSNRGRERTDNLDGTGRDTEISAEQTESDVGRANELADVRNQAANNEWEDASGDIWDKVEGTSEITAKIVSDDYLNSDTELASELRTIKAKAEADGLKVTFIVGSLGMKDKVGNYTARGLHLPSGEMVIRVDSDNATATQIYNHEDYHQAKLANPNIVEDTRMRFLQSHTEQELDNIVRNYAKAYGFLALDKDGKYDEDTFKAIAAKIREEVFADAHAEMPQLPETENVKVTKEAATEEVKRAKAKAKETKESKAKALPKAEEITAKSRKQKQFDIINRTNPKNKELNPGAVWIEKVDDIFDFKEAVDDSGMIDWTDDYTKEDMQKALDSGEITVYSSKPITDGMFVTPSKMEAQNYAGDGKVYSKKVSVDDVAWIDSFEGQYTPLSSENISSIDDVRTQLNKGVTAEQITEELIPDELYTKSELKDAGIDKSRELDDKLMSDAEKKNDNAKDDSYGHADEEALSKVKSLRASIAKRFNDKNDLQPYLPEEFRGQTIKGNQSYGRSIENSLVCIRSLLSGGFLDKVSEKLGRPLTIDEQLIACQVLANITGNMKECAYCYVKNDRAAYRAFFNKYWESYSDIYAKANKNKAAYAESIKMGKGDENTLYHEFLGDRKNTDQMWKRYCAFAKDGINGKKTISLNDLATANTRADARKVKGKGWFMTDAEKYCKSSARPTNLKREISIKDANGKTVKIPVEYVSYNGSILSMKKELVDTLNSEYGLRMYSYSDYVPHNILENIQMVTDASVRGLKMLAYTKDIGFAKVFAPTNMGINISVFGSYNAKTGKVDADEMQGANWKEAQDLRKKYGNVGVVFVATNDEAVTWALNQEWIDVVIPFHTVTTGTEEAKYYQFKDYKSTQGDRKLKGWTKDNLSSIPPTIHANNKEQYLAALKANNLSPRFNDWIDNPNYMKLVNETRMAYTDMQPVQPTFNTDDVMAELNRIPKEGIYGGLQGNLDAEAQGELIGEYADVATYANRIKNGEKNKDTKKAWAIEDVPADLRENVQTAIKADELQRASHSREIDAEGNKLTSNQQKYFAESKVRDEDGKLKVVYHGTSSDFTVFDKKRIGNQAGFADGAGFYFSDKIDGKYEGSAKTYGSKILKGYLNIVNPIRSTSKEKTIPKDKFVKIFDKMQQQNGVWAAYKFETIWEEASSDYYIVSAFNHRSTRDYLTLTPTQIIDGFSELGFDGVITDLGDVVNYVAFNSNQFKNIDNLNPTADEDIRHSREWTPGQTMKYKSEQYLNRAENRLTYSLIDALQASKYANRKFVKEAVKRVSDEFFETGTISEKTRDDLFKEAYEQARVNDEHWLQENKRLKDMLDNTVFAVSDFVLKDIPDSNAWLRGARKYLKFAPDGESIDSKYKDLMDAYPSMFPDFGNESDEISHILDVVKSISTSERTLDQHYGEFSKEYMEWSRRSFDEALNRHITELNRVKRYNESAAPKAKKEITAEDVKDAYSKVHSARKTVEKVVSKNILTAEDEIIVGRLLRGEETLENLDSSKYNVRGIKEVYEAKKAYEDINKIIGTYKAQLKEKLRAEAAELLKSSNTWKDKSSGFAYARETLARNLRDIIPDKGLAKAVTDYLYAPIVKAQADKVRYKNVIREKVASLNLSRKVASGNTCSESFAVQFIGEAEDNLRYLREHPQTKERAGLTASDWQQEIDALWHNNPNLDKAKIDNAIKVFRELYDQIREDINNVYLANGYEPVPYRSGYFMHFMQEESDSVMGKVASALGIRTDVTDLPTEINGRTGMFRPGRTWFGSGLERKGNNTVYDAVLGIDKYLESASDVIYDTDNIQRLRQFAQEARYKTSDEGLQAQIDEIRESNVLTEAEKDAKIAELYAEGSFALSNFVVELDEYTNQLANKKSKYDRGAESLIGRKMYNIVKAVEGNVAANLVGVNPASWLTNFIPLTQAFTTVDSKHMLMGMWDTLKGYKYNDGFSDSSDYLTGRFGSDHLVPTWAEKMATSKIGAVRQTWQAGADKLGVGMDLVDDFTSESIVRARYYQNLDSGMSEANAIKEADSFAANLQAARTKGSMPTIFGARNPIFKLFTQFQLEVNNEFSWLLKDVPEELAGQAVAKIATSLLKFLIGTYLFNDLYEFIVGRRPALDPLGILNDTVGDISGYKLPNAIDFALGRDDFKTEKKSAWDSTTALAGNLVEELPFVGGVLGGGRVPISSGLPDIEKIGKTLLSDTESSYKKSVVGEELGKSVLYLALPGGGAQANKMYKGVKSIAEGGSYKLTKDGTKNLQYPVWNETTADLAENVPKGLLFGKSSFKTARDWVESGFNTLNTNYTQMYDGIVKVGVSQKDAWKFVNEFKNIKATDDETATKLKEDYILNSKISDEAKGIVYDAMQKNPSKSYTQWKNMGGDPYDYLKLQNEGYPLKEEALQKIEDRGVTADDIIKAYNKKPEITDVKSNGYKSSTELVKAVGGADTNEDWHHIVEQEQDFPAEKIQNTNNIVSIQGGTKSMHSLLTKYYGTEEVQNKLKDMSFDEQWQFGVDYLSQFGTLVPSENSWVLVTKDTKSVNQAIEDLDKAEYKEAADDYVKNGYSEDRFYSIIESFDGKPSQKKVLQYFKDNNVEAKEQNWWWNYFTEKYDWKKTINESKKANKISSAEKPKYLSAPGKLNA